MLDSDTKLICIIGNPAKHSLSPVMFNAAFKHRRINTVYLAFEPANLRYAVLGLKSLGAIGIICTIPYKEEVLKFLDGIDPTAKKIGAVNTIVNKDGKLYGYNTDWIGVNKAILETTKIRSKRIALLGSGGAAKAVAYGFKKEGGKVFIFNRTLNKAEELVEKLNLEKAYSLNQQDKIIDMDIIANTTSVGMEPYEKACLLDKKIIQKNHVVFDAIYTPQKTQLLKHAESAGAKVIYGHKMLLYVGAAIYEIFTKKKAPVTLMEKELTKNLH